MPNRRDFFSSLAGGAAALAVSGRILGANDRVRFGIIGAGARQMEDFRAALACPNVEAVAAADVYSARFAPFQALAPNMKTYGDFRKLLDDKSIDAVLIATPQHLHALHFVPSIQAGKDVYQEKTMAFSPAHARRMRDAFEGSGRVVQIGMQMNSGPGLQKVARARGPRAHGHDHGDPGVSISATRRTADGCARSPPTATPSTSTGRAFEGEAKSYPFDAQRFINWRFFWDYSGGNVFENMVHQVGFWYGALGLNIPESVTMTGGNYLSPQMQVPDTMNVVMVQPEKLIFTWSSMFGNNYFSEGYDYLFGTDGTLIHDESDHVAYLPQRRRGNAPPAAEGDAAPPIAKGGYKDYTAQHMQNFFDCVRSRKEPNCPFDLGYRTAIACQMANASYRQRRTVRWDAAKEDIV